MSFLEEREAAIRSEHKKPIPKVFQTTEFFSGFHVEAGFEELDSAALRACRECENCDGGCLVKEENKD